jgi:adenylate kinase
VRLAHAKRDDLIFVGGIYGSGKSTFCSQICEKLGAQHLKASELAQHQVKGVADLGKAVDDVDANQRALLANLAHKRHEADVTVLDGHYCIYNKSLLIEEIALSVFASMHPRLLILIDIAPEAAIRRLAQRDRASFDLRRLTELRTRENAHAQRISKSLGVLLATVPYDVNVNDVLPRISEQVGI